MMRTMLQMSRRLAAVATFALPAMLMAPDTRQIVAVLPFDNASIGPSAHDYDLLGKGIQDLLVTELASSASVRVVDRAHIQQVMDEQKITRDQLADPATQLRLGKILNAHYMITGSFISDGKSQVVLTSRSIDVETTQVGNPEKIQDKADDILGTVNKLVAKVAADLKLPALTATPGTPGNVGSAQQSGGSKPAAGNASPATQPATAAGGTVEYAKALPPAELKKTNAVKLDFKTAVIYGQACDAQDQKQSAKATQLFKQVLAKSPDFVPAQEHLAQLQ
ncbi:MAG TPA: CsgG/HfaB family protein [Gemmatimonadaceae bacterium]|nr:CsgG/HfaB family protein [Gemmatimonadaceae bacterium]